MIDFESGSIKKVLIKMAVLNNLKISFELTILIVLFLIFFIVFGI